MKKIKPLNATIDQDAPVDARGCAPWIVAAVIVVGLLVALRAMAVVIPAGHRGVMFNRLRGGVQTKAVLGEGLTLVNPLTTDVILMNVRSQTYTMSNAEQEGQVHGRDGIEARTKDGQIVNIDVSVRYHVEPKLAASIYQDLGLDYESKVLLPTIRSVVRNAVGQHPVDVVYSEKRETLAKVCGQAIAAAVQRRGIVVETFLLRDISFTPEYATAIEVKQIEQQNALRKFYDLEYAKKDAQRQRIVAEGEALANDIRGAALKANPKVIQYDYLRKLAPNVQAVIVDSDEVKRGSFAPAGATP